MENIKVLYIAGSGRSGTTLLGELLGQSKDIFNAGELRYIWEKSIKENLLCGCEKTFHDCVVWQEIISRAFKGLNNIRRYEDEIIKLQYSVDRIRYIPFLKYGRFKNNLQTYTEKYLYPLYASINEVTRTNIIIDISKYPSYLYLLAGCDFIDLSVIHLVRDSRGVAFSWNKKKLYENSSTKTLDIHKYSSTKSSSDWLIHNTLFMWMGKNIGADKFMFIKYEDFVDDPRGTINDVSSMLGVDIDLSFINDGNEASLNNNHIIAGNPLRFKSRQINIKLDDEWKKSMAFKEKIIVSLMTYPLLRKYRYGV